ncbi:MAG: helix-turn-helix transcriptional regulator [Cytophagales bacterium]|nr:helix-turn-helix transcriptional regulator [Cytophagales bacterium]
MNKAETYTSKISEDFLQELTPEEADKIEKRMLLAAKIDDSLKSKGWKQKDLAESLNKQPSEITKWLSGTHNFTTDTLWDIERVLGIELVRLEEKPQEQVILFHLSISEDAEIKDPFDYGQLYYGSLLSTGQKKIIRQYEPLISYQA